MIYWLFADRTGPLSSCEMPTQQYLQRVHKPWYPSSHPRKNAFKSLLLKRRTCNTIKIQNVLFCV